MAAALDSGLTLTNGLPPVTATTISALIPRVHARVAEWFEMPSVARNDGHVRGLSDGGDERGIEWGVFGESVGGQETRGSVGVSHDATATVDRDVTFAHRLMAFPILDTEDLSQCQELHTVGASREIRPSMRLMRRSPRQSPRPCTFRSSGRQRQTGS